MVSGTMPSSASLTNSAAAQRSMALRNALAFLLAATLGCSTTSMTADPAPPKGQLAPTAKLRAVINVGYPVLANNDPASHQPPRHAAVLARVLARRHCAPLQT